MQSLFSKYRPKALDELVGNEHITKFFKGVIKRNTLGNVFLFVGPRGTGKTTTARILANIVNGEDLNDIIEMDAASNRGVDDIARIIEDTQYTPLTGTKKIYIIDEVHQLSSTAKDTLLKTLEEPPDYCMFILATTEAHRVPETVASRCQKIIFYPPSTTKMIEFLTTIAKKEVTNIDPNIIGSIAYHSNGSFRDALNYLDMIISATGEVTDVDILKFPPTALLVSIANKIINGDESVLKEISIIKEREYQTDVILGLVVSQLYSAAKRMLINKTGKPDKICSVCIFMQEYINKFNNVGKYLLLEMVILSAVFKIKELLNES